METQVIENDLSEVEKCMALIARQHHGHLTPEAVLEAARNKNSVLHDYFEWDDAKAGEAYRLEQARTLIRSVRYEVRTEHRRVSLAKYVHDPMAGANEPCYIRVPRSKSEHARAFIADEVDRAMALLHRSHAYAIDTKQEAAAKALSKAITILKPFTSDA